MDIVILIAFLSSAVPGCEFVWHGTPVEKKEHWFVIIFFTMEQPQPDHYVEFLKDGHGDSIYTCAGTVINSVDNKKTIVVTALSCLAPDFAENDFDLNSLHDRKYFAAFGDGQMTNLSRGSFSTDGFRDKLFGSRDLRVVSEVKKVIPIENPYLAPLYFEDRNTKQATFFINKAYLIVEGGFAYEPLETCPDSFYEDESILKRNSTDRNYSYEFYVLSIGWDGNKPVSSIYKKTMWEVPLKDCRNDLWSGYRGGTAGYVKYDKRHGEVQDLNCMKGFGLCKSDYGAPLIFRNLSSTEQSECLFGIHSFSLRAPSYNNTFNLVDHCSVYQYHFFEHLKYWIETTCFKYMKIQKWKVEWPKEAFSTD